MKFSWKDVRKIKNKFNIPIILKGIATEEDAKICVDEGIEVIYISNHGGRQFSQRRVPSRTPRPVKAYERASLWPRAV